MFKFISEEAGATSLEFGVVSALVSIIVIGSFASLGFSLTNKYGEIALSTTSALSSEVAFEEPASEDYYVPVHDSDAHDLGVGGTSHHSAFSF